MKYCCQIILVLLLLLPLLGRGQEMHITGRVVDAATKGPVPFASLSLLNSGKDTLTDEFGNFQIEGGPQINEDSLVVRTLGYYPSTFFVKTGALINLNLELKPKYIILPKPLQINKPPYGYYGSQEAFFVQGQESNHSKKIRSVSVYLGHLGLPKEEFRFRIYKASGANNPPCIDLLNEDVFVSPGIREGWNTIDFRDYPVNVPVGGFYIALEFVFCNHFFCYSKPLVGYIPSGAVLYPSSVPEESGFWRYEPDAGWYQIPITNAGFLKYSRMITVEVK